MHYSLIANFNGDIAIAVAERESNLNNEAIGTLGENQIKKLIIKYSKSMNVDENIALSIVQIESQFNPNAIGTKSDIGLFQLREKFYPNFSRKELLIPEINIILGLKKLKDDKEFCIHKQNLDWLTCFNLGRTGAKNIKTPSNFSYVKKVRDLINER